MKINILFVSIIILVISCTNRDYDRKDSNFTTEKIGDLSLTALNDSGLAISIIQYKVETTIEREFNKNAIPIKICATLESNGNGNIDSIIVDFKSKKHKVLIGEYFIQSPQEIISIKKFNDYGVRFNDYNFDNLPDVAIYSSTSGMQNIMEDIFIYNAEKNKFVYNKILSTSSNCAVDNINKEIHTFGNGGMAGMIYNSETYTWEENELKLIKTERQNFIDKINLFVKETKTLVDTSWQTTLDTLSEEKILEMREKQ